MQNSRFIVLTGHLKEYPLSDVIGILRHQRKTGRLSIDYPSAPGLFFFKDGDLVDAQFGPLRGVQAILVATNQPDAPFNFNPLIQPSEQSITNPFQKVVLEMLGCWQDEIVLDTEFKSEPPLIESGEDRASKDVAIDAPHFVRKVLPGGNLPAALPPAAGVSSKPHYRKRILIFAGALLLLGAIAPATVLRGYFGRQAEPAAALTESGKPQEPAPAPAPPANSDDPSRLPESETDRARDMGVLYGFSDLESDTHQTVTADSTRGRVKETTRAQTPKRLKAETAASRGAAPSAPDERAGALKAPSRAEGTSSDRPTITVVTQVENGRVVQAYVANRRPGMEAFEAAALRAARQRRYPPGTTGNEKVQVKISKQ